MDVAVDKRTRLVLGLRAALGERVSRATLERLAEDCLRRSAANQAAWASDRALPALRIEGEEHLRAALGAGRGAVIATLHIGPYHRCPFALLRLGLPVGLLLDEVNFERQRALHDGWAHHFADVPGKVDMRYVNVERPNAVIEIAAMLRRGGAAFVYADGNAGFAGANPRNFVEIEFCGLRVRVRKGLAYLSGHTGAPIVQMTARFAPDGGEVIAFCPPLARGAGEDAEAYCARAMQAVYDAVEPVVAADPAGWEEWFHFFEWIVTEPRPDGELGAGKVRLAEEHVELVHSEQGPLLVNCLGGGAMLVTPQLKAVAERLDGERSAAEVVAELASDYGAAAVTDVLRALLRLGLARGVNSELHEARSRKGPRAV